MRSKNTGAHNNRDGEKERGTQRYRERQSKREREREDTRLEEGRDVMRGGEKVKEELVINKTPAGY